MIYIIAKNDKNINEIKKLVKETNINEVEVVYSIDENTKINNSDIIICDYIDDIKKDNFNKTQIILYKANKINRKLIDNYQNIYICKNQSELKDKLNFIKIISRYKKNLKHILVILIFLLIIIFTFGFIYFLNLKPIKKEKRKIDFTTENIVLYGDSITDYYDVEKHFKNLPIVNSGISGNGVDNLYGELKERVYRYNPTKVFIMIGTNDLSHRDDKYIYQRITEIINKINKNRPNAEVYLESLYPVNRNTNNDIVIDWMVGNRTNERIKGLNKKLSMLCDKENVNCKYINMFDKLTDENGDMNLSYTKDGLHLSEAGYNIVTKELMNYIDPKLDKKVEKK